MSRPSFFGRLATSHSDHHLTELIMVDHREEV